MAERKTERFPDFHLPHPDLKILRNPRFLSILGLFVVTGGYVGIKQYQDYLNELNKRPAPRSQTIDTPPSFAPAVVPIDAATATATRKPTEIPSPSATATGTAKPIDTATATATGTATEVPASPTTAPTRTATKEAEKPPLSEYAVFTGPLLKKGTQEEIGTIVVSYLPKPVNQGVVYYLSQRSGRPFLFSPTRYLDGRRIGFESAVIGRYEIITVNTIKPGEISGTLDFRDGSKHMIFTALLSGQGRNDFLQIYKQTKRKELNLGSGGGISDELVIKELAKDNIILP